MSWLIAFFVYLFFNKRKNEPEYFYKSNEKFAQEQVIKHHPELLYQLASKQYESGEISKTDYDKAIDSLIKDIVI